MYSRAQPQQPRRGVIIPSSQLRFIADVACRLGDASPHDSLKFPLFLSLENGGQGPAAASLLWVVTCVGDCGLHARQWTYGS